MRRFALFLAALAVTPLPARADLVFVLNSLNPDVQVIDAATRQEVRRIPILREPHHLVLTPARDMLLIADSGGNEIHFVDPQTGEVRKRERVANPYHLDFTPDGKLLVVTGLRRDQVDIYNWDGTSLNLAGRVRPGDMPSHIAFKPDSTIAYVTVQGSRRVAAIDLRTREVIWNVEVGREPAGIIWHNDRLLVGIMGSDHIAVLNPETRQIERRIFIGRGAHAIFPAPDGQRLYVTSRVDSRITALDARTLDPIRSYDVPGGPDCLSFDPQGRIWTTLRWSRQLGMLDPATGEVVTSPIGRSPHGIFYSAGARVPAGAGTPTASLR
ncbi:YncE family protein [Roseomonas sp. CCTCC AB2023176]|uniref:YncE family protein n=1 Tax=Roseomonas sp. CCTCC AB2023176 TaxID=3342640 RepID=UPI0035D98A77